MNHNSSSSIFRNSNCNNYRLTLFSFTNSHIQDSIILRSSYINISSSISMSIITRINHFNFMNTRSFINQSHSCSTINNSSIIFMTINHNSHITCRIITNNHNNSTITLINNNNIIFSHVNLINSKSG